MGDHMMYCVLCFNSLNILIQIQIYILHQTVAKKKKKKKNSCLTKSLWIPAKGYLAISEEPDEEMKNTHHQVRNAS